MVISVMVNGLPGRMATKVAGYILESDDFELFNASFGSGRSPNTFVWTTPVNIFGPDTMRSEVVVRLLEKSRPDLTVDYTIPDAVNDNAEFYCTHGLNFVMGTTGGDREALEARVRGSGVVAVIAPNMAKQIVALQAMFVYAAENFPGAFKGYRLSVEESHQKSKRDTSGTARAMVGYFNRLGIPFRVDQIEMIRDPDLQRGIGVPEEHLNGHGWYMYGLTLEDGSVAFSFSHDVNGRDVYAVGTLDALRYLQRKVEAGERGKVYSMIDVLKGE